MPQALRSPSKPTKMPNVIHLDSDELPDIKNWTPGQRYRVVLDIEQVNMSVGGSAYEPKGKGDKVEASFRVLSARPQYGSGPVKQATNGKPDKSATMSALQRKAGQ